ncbi:MULTISPECIES: hypothetical protein [Amycolatopsis]|uniref:Histidine kinase-like ATPase domain-containing protein n=2 Tax=Amycolatopsis TaxID=1813 RepID=A0A1I3XKG2_9PSEU|nr:hypothetical protein [Amycolatopsis sacchari]SFK19536.1 hypothetical protein SAMN05421835_115136 [Amycolatopsis sacchari]
MVARISRPPEEIRFVLDGPAALAVLRRRVRDLLSGVAEKDLIDALLVVNEVATLAWISAGGPCAVRVLKLRDGTARTEVACPAEAAWTDSARLLLDGLAARWGIDGTTLWAEVVLAPPWPRAALEGDFPAVPEPDPS